MEEIQSLLVKYARKGIVVDTNILLLLFVGLTNRDRIKEFKRTDKFISEDYDTLVQLLEKFSLIVVTPNILTEVNSFINQLKEPERSQCLLIFSKLISTEKFDEKYIEAQQVVSQQEFIRFGLTDCGIVEVARDRYLVLTEDLKFSSHLYSLGIDTINFNNIRTLNW
jgi:rRNA-processing protein FCF1